MFKTKKNNKKTKTKKKTDVPRQSQVLNLILFEITTA